MDATLDKKALNHLLGLIDEDPEHKD